MRKKKKMDKNANTINERRVTTYPSPRDRRLLDAYADELGENMSKTTAGIIRQFFNQMPPDERARLLNKSKNHY